MNLHVGNLSPKVTEEEIKELFSQFGTVSNVSLEWTKRAGRSGGTAIVQMHLTEAMTAARQLNNRPFRSRRLYISLMGDATTGKTFSGNAEVQSR